LSARRATRAAIRYASALAAGAEPATPGGAMALSDVRAAAADIRRRLDQIRDSL